MLVKNCQLAFPRKNHKIKNHLYLLKLKGAPSPKISTRKNVTGVLCMYEVRFTPLGSDGFSKKRRKKEEKDYTTPYKHSTRALHQNTTLHTSIQ
jgi:hypothetical protein